MWMKPPRSPAGPRVASRCMSPKKRWLHTKVPALLDTDAGTPAARRSRTMALMGSVEKYAAGAPATTGSSIGWQPALSQMRPSSTLMATRSGVTSKASSSRVRLRQSVRLHAPA